jgi:DNA-binding LacI/PurR family transcriptional regulator
VTQATVSLVINNSNRINPATRQRVEQAILDLGYATNMVARSLVTRNTHVLSLVTPALSADSEHFMMPLLQGILMGLEQEEYILNYSQGPSGKTTIETVQREVKRNRAAGLFIVSPHPDESNYLEYMLGEGIPFVLVNRRHENVDIPCVAVDYADIAYRAIGYLHRRGHSRIACINGPRFRPSSGDRLRGIRMAYQELGLEINEAEMIVEGNFQLDGGYRAMRQLLTVNPRPTAVFSGNDFQALGAIQAIHEAGLRVPNDVAIIGCDDWQMSSWIRPALTTVRAPFHEMGVIATQQLCRLVRGEVPPSRQIILPSQLIERESV